MARDTPISWAGATWNIITGCTVLSPGCQRCYAMKLAGGRMSSHWSRVGLTVPSKNGPVWNGQTRFNRPWLYDPVKWRAPTVIFVCAHSDLFHESVDDAQIDEIMGVIAACPRHLFLVLTKRTARAVDYFSKAALGLEERIYPYWSKAAMQSRTPEPFPNLPFPNLWLGASIEDQQHTDQRLPELLSIDAALHWVSVEPMLGPVDLAPWLYTPIRLDEVPGYALNDAPGAQFVKPSGKIGLVIAGGESQTGARWLPSQYVRDLRDQVLPSGAVFHFKQWGAWLPKDQVSTAAQRSAVFKADVEWRDEPPIGAVAYKVGPNISGHLLDGVEYRDMPAWGA